MNFDLNPFHRNNHYMTCIAMFVSLAMLFILGMLGYSYQHEYWSEFRKLAWEMRTLVIVLIYGLLFLPAYLFGCLSIYVSKQIPKWIRKRRLKLRAFVYNPLVETRENIQDWDEYEKLYYSEFAEDHGDPSTTDMHKWLVDTMTKKPFKENDELDFMIFAKSKSRICGFLKVYYCYKSRGFSYLSYLLNKENAKDAELIVPEMGRVLQQMLKRELHGCIGIVADTGMGDKRYGARIQLFTQRAKKFIDHSTLWNLNDCKLEYELPCTKANPEGKSETSKPTTLLYVRTRRNEKFHSKRSPDHEEIRKILFFVYQVVYANCFPEDMDKNEEYRNYAKVIHDRVLKNYETTLSS